jgi:hypothetical protein
LLAAEVKNSGPSKSWFIELRPLVFHVGRIFLVASVCVFHGAEPLCLVKGAGITIALKIQSPIHGGLSAFALLSKDYPRHAFANLARHTGGQGFLCQ